MIEICNLRVVRPSMPYDVVVDRRSVLGNPFHMKDESERDQVCDLYACLFELIEPGDNDPRAQALRSLLETYLEHDRIRLFCWCAPRRCHAETIKSWLEVQYENIRSQEATEELCR